MVHLVHSALHWKLRYIQDSSDSEDENTPPNVSRMQSPESKSPTQKCSDDKCCDDKNWDDTSSTGTATPPWMSPGFRELGYSRRNTNKAPSSPSLTEMILSPSRRPREVASPTTSSPVILETTPRPSPVMLKTTAQPSPLVGARTKGLQNRRYRRESAAPYSRPRLLRAQEGRPITNPSGCTRAATMEASGPKQRSHQNPEILAPVRWPHNVAHLREQFNPWRRCFLWSLTLARATAKTCAVLTLAAMPS